MKNLLVLSIIVIFAGSASADLLYQNSNPFPQTSPETMNNIYQSEPSVIKQDEKKEVKQIMRSKGQVIQGPSGNVQDMPIPPVRNERQYDNGVYTFTTGK